MNDMSGWQDVSNVETSPSHGGRWFWWLALVLIAAGGAGAFWFTHLRTEAPAAVAAVEAPPPVAVSVPLQLPVDTSAIFLGQFSAVDRIELRAQVGGTLTQIHFRDGQVVKKGDPLFEIDPRPYEVKLAQAKAQLQTANSRLELAVIQLSRAQKLRSTDFGSQQTLDERASEKAAAVAAVDDAEARIRDAQLDLEYSRVTAPFAGRMGARQVSVGSLVAGSRAGAGQSTLLATIVSIDPIYLDFDMSESDYLTFARERAKLSGPLASEVFIALSDEKAFTREGRLDFVDNAVNRSSGTIRARATVENGDHFLTPGSFARLRVALAPPAPTLLIPDAAVILDQSQRVVMTVAGDGTVVPKIVETGDLRGSLRVVRAGLAKEDRVIVDGLVRARPGGKVTPELRPIAEQMASDEVAAVGKK